MDLYTGDLLSSCIELPIAYIIIFVLLLILIMTIIIMIIDLSKFQRSYEEDKKLAHYDEMVLENEKLRQAIDIKKRYRK